MLGYLIRLIGLRDPIRWLYTIAQRSAIDELRKRKRSRVKLTDDGAPRK
jgi:DNA-directed RNA polymerase specialized sigma24 family protein